MANSNLADTMDINLPYGLRNNELVSIEELLALARILMPDQRNYSFKTSFTAPARFDELPQNLLI